MTKKINERPGSRGCTSVTRLSNYLRSPFESHYSMCLQTAQHPHQKSIVRLSSMFSLLLSAAVLSRFIYLFHSSEPSPCTKGTVLSAAALSLVHIFMLTLHGPILFGLRFSPFYTQHQLSGP
ncbi:hypothetical protein IW261DRAFT_1491613 [Armillaria novae-zelandiae]|uniref:Uncharacterized protein n=1 Tax=Armillaria novae-zelandiae TaxID=153914 RepID=A0AA39P1V5_9AGAR|nr:hypothetical protein IW261DRAFT_1491613 [Armillaria novae-zelandiae]